MIKSFRNVFMKYSVLSKYRQYNSIMPIFSRKYTKINKRLFSENLKSNSEISDYQAPNDPNDNFEDINNEEFKFVLNILLYIFGAWMTYDLLFITRNQFSGKRTFKIISKSIESYIAAYYMEKHLYEPYKKLLLKSTTEEHKRVINILRTIIEKNELNHEIDLYKVKVYDLPNLFIIFTPDKTLSISTKTLLLCKNDDELSYLIGHEIAHFLMGHGAKRILLHHFSIKKLIERANQNYTGLSMVNDFDRLTKLNEFICYYPSYSLCDKFEERDTDVLTHSLLKSCLEFNPDKVFFLQSKYKKRLKIIERIEKYMKGYPLRMRKINEISMKYIYDRKSMNKEILEVKDAIKPLSAYFNKK